MPRAKKGQQNVPILKKTTGLCPSGSYYSMILANRLDELMTTKLANFRFNYFYQWFSFQMFSQQAAYSTTS